MCRGCCSKHLSELIQAAGVCVSQAQLPVCSATAARKVVARRATRAAAFNAVRTDRYGAGFCITTVCTATSHKPPASSVPLRQWRPFWRWSYAHAGLLLRAQSSATLQRLCPHATLLKGCSPPRGAALHWACLERSKQRRNSLSRWQYACQLLLLPTSLRLPFLDPLHNVGSTTHLCLGHDFIGDPPAVSHGSAPAGARGSLGGWIRAATLPARAPPAPDCRAPAFQHKTMIWPGAGCRCCWVLGVRRARSSS